MRRICIFGGSPCPKLILYTKKQKSAHPKLEDACNKYLDGENRPNALVFAAWLRANKMPSQWAYTQIHYSLVIKKYVFYS